MYSRSSPEAAVMYSLMNGKAVLLKTKTFTITKITVRSNYYFLFKTYWFKEMIDPYYVNCCTHPHTERQPLLGNITVLTDKRHKGKKTGNHYSFHFKEVSRS